MKSKHKCKECAERSKRYAEESKKYANKCQCEIKGENKQ